MRSDDHQSYAVVSRADLLWYFLSKDQLELDSFADSIGFYRDTSSSVSLINKETDQNITNKVIKPKLESPELPPVEQEKMHFYRVTKREAIETNNSTPSGYPEWYESNTETLLDHGRSSLIPEHQLLKFQPLVSWSRLWPFLHKSLSTICSGWQPDIECLVKKISRGELITQIPVKQRKTWASTAMLLIDINSATFSLRHDFIYLRDKLSKLRGGYGLQLRYLDDEPGANVYYWEHEQESVEAWKTPESDTPLLIISDMGALTHSKRKLMNWLVFGRKLATQGCRPIVLMPVPKRLIDSRLLRYFNCVSWDRGNQLKPLLNAYKDKTKPEHHQLKTTQLLTRLAPAVRVNSSLLRATRYCTSSSQFDVGHEAAVWQHPAIQNHGDELVWQVSDHEQFLQDFKKLPDLQQQLMISFIAQYHATLPEVLYFEAMQNCMQASPKNVDEAVKVAAERYLQALLRTYIENPEYKSLEQWTGRYRVRQKADLLRHDNKVLAGIWGEHIKRSTEIGKDIPRPIGINKQQMQAFLSANQPLIKYQLCQKGRKLVFSPAITTSNTVDDFGVQNSVMTMLSMSSDFITRETTTEEGLKASHIIRFSPNKTVSIAMAGTRSYELETNKEKVIIEPLYRPDWAVAIGNDSGGLYAETKSSDTEKYKWYWNPPAFSSISTLNTELNNLVEHPKTYRGIWYPLLFKDQLLPTETPTWADTLIRDEIGLMARITIKGVEQWFRWIEPTSFEMGSPDGKNEEKGRYDNEKQHQVILSQGYWLAETACTQALWEAVMGNNPSDFKDPNKPVENVNWDDTQKFIEKINTQYPALNLSLPTEAQWENACRAGSTTAFNFEGELSLDKVNYCGTWNDYEKYDEGALRQTAPVKSYPANQWGLYEMHGNVLEWCQDWYGSYSAEQDIDPAGADTGTYRVLRGGSWANGGRHVRSAYRGFNSPGYRDYDYGFRLARGSFNSPVRSVRAGQQPDEAQVSGAPETQLGDEQRASDLAQKPKKKGLFGRAKDLFK